MERTSTILVNIGLVIGSLVLCLVVLEIILRIRAPWPKSYNETDPVPTHVVCTDCPFLYHPNPDHPEISEQYLRDTVYAVPKPDGVFRILLLGDSVTFGPYVPRDSTFADVLERSLRARFDAHIEVINAGVRGYTPYNELQYYLSDGRTFEPDLVLVSFVLNDMVNPRLHWNYTRQVIADVPDEAIPNLEDDRRRVRWLLRSALARWVHLRMTQSFVERGESDASGHQRSVHLTGEDRLHIQSLMDPECPEWQWLRLMYTRLDAAVRRDGADFAVAVFPLHYQLEEDYPYIPQTVLRQYCTDHGIPCLDLLPALRRHMDEDLFMIERAPQYGDIWHLTEAGHRVAATALESFLVDSLQTTFEPSANVVQ